MRARRIALVVAMSMALMATACGGDHSQVTVGPPTAESGGGDGATSVPGGLADCAAILKTYVSLATTALRGKDAAAQAQKTLDGIKDDFPSSLQGDLKVVADAFGSLASKGIIQGASALRTHEFIEANKNILGYLRHDCLPG